MTVKDVIAQCRELGISARRTGYGQEWRIAYPGKGNEASAGYPESNDEAIALARHMARERQTDAGRGQT